jgi:hypothetical protein
MLERLLPPDADGRRAATADTGNWKSGMFEWILFVFLGAAARSVLTAHPCKKET